MASEEKQSTRLMTRRHFLTSSLIGIGAIGLAACSPATQAPKAAPTEAATAPAQPATGNATPAAPAAPASGAAKKTYAFKVAHVESMNSPMEKAFARWVKIMEEKSDGALKPQYFPASQLGSITQLVEANRMGTIELIAGGPDLEVKLAPSVAALSIGYLFKSEQHVDKVLQGPINDKLLAEVKEKTGVEFLAWGEEGFRHMFTKKPVKSLADFKGMKIRVTEQEISLRLIQLLGANPVPVAYTELYNALQSGVVDGAEQTVFGLLGYKFYEPAPNVAMTYHWFMPKAIRINSKWMESLPKELQTVLRDTAKSVFAEERADNRKSVDATTQQLKDLGVKFNQVDVEEWRKAAIVQHDEYAKQFPSAAETIQAIKALAQ